MTDRFKNVVNQLLATLDTSTGQVFIDRFATEIANLFGADNAVIAVIDPQDPGQLQPLAICGDGRLDSLTVWPLAGSPGAEVIDSAAPCVFRSRVQNRFPGDHVLRQADANCYTGVPLFAHSGDILGVAALLGRHNIDDDLLAVESVQLFADRVVAELERLSVEVEHQHVQQQLADCHKRCEADLEKTRHELEALGHAVSHDLRGPLRAIDGFSEILMSDYADSLDETAGSHLRRIRTNVRQMDDLLHGLLILSRVTRHRLGLSQVNLSRLCAKSIAQLQTHDPHRPVAVSIQSDVHACCDPDLMTIVLDQLLDNAWKYTDANATAHIEFSVDRQQDETVYRLADNGAGFDMAYADKLFELFQRLHSQREIPGVGAGLSIVRRIIERHGGRIWAQALPGKGASFYFTLPAPPDDTCKEQAVSSTT